MNNNRQYDALTRSTTSKHKGNKLVGCVGIVAGVGVVGGLAVYGLDKLFTAGTDSIKTPISQVETPTTSSSTGGELFKHFKLDPSGFGGLAVIAAQRTESNPS